MSIPAGTLMLSRADVASLLTLEACIGCVEEAFRKYGLGQTSAPRVLGMHSGDGSFHIKAALLSQSGSWFAAKLNGNFPGNNQRFGLPNIQGVITLCDAANGFPLAVMDSIEITILRTGAATAIAAKHLARPDSKVATICGCGTQGRVQLRALRQVCAVEHVYAFDLDRNRAEKFAREMANEVGVEVEVIERIETGLGKSDLCATCTPAKKYFIHKDDVRAGTFLAAVGADNEDKQEIDPQLLVSSKVVADVLDQSVTIGDVHHAVSADLMQRDGVYAELGELVAGKKPGRTSADEITVFDSTGTALQDVAAAVVVYQKAIEQGRGTWFRF